MIGREIAARFRAISEPRRVTTLQATTTARVDAARPTYGRAVGLGRVATLGLVDGGEAAGGEWMATLGVAE
jgi:hypothetical protein